MTSKTKKYVGFAFPGDIAQETFKNNSEIIFINEKNYKILLKDHRESFHYRFNNEDLFFKNSSLIIRTKEIRDEINNWSTLWTRWISKSEKYEIFRENSSLHIIKIILTLSSLNIRCMIFHTSVPHHFDSFCIYLACKILKIPTIFLYSTVINGDLLPLIQKNGINTRKPFNKKISNTKYDLIIEDFINNLKEKKPPKTNPKNNRFNTSFVFSLIALNYLSLKHKIYRKIFKTKSNQFYSDYSFLSKISILNQQRIFLKIYDKKKIDSPKHFLHKTKTSLIIFAHYQPEATTMPEGGDYISHIDVVSTLRIKGHKNKIFYKEHPASWMFLYEMDNKISDITRVGLHRYPSYLDLLSNLNCIFLSKDFKIEEKYLSNFMPVTIGGGIALERSLLGLRTIVFGEPWFKKIPGLIHINEIENLDLIPKEWTLPNQELAQKARTWLKNTLSYKTISNRLKIGSPNPFINQSNLKETKDELNNLLEIIKKEF